MSMNSPFCTPQCTASLLRLRESVLALQFRKALSRRAGLRSVLTGWCASFAVLLICPVVQAESTAAATAPTFERDIRPILRAHCLDCHGAVEDLEGGLDLRLVRFIVKGGDSGPALTPGDVASSYLIDRVRSGEMPPGEHRLTAAEISTLEQWIAAGAPTARPEPETIGPGLQLLPEDREWWAYQPLTRPEVNLKSHPRVRNEIDALLTQAMPEGLSLSPDADRLTLMKRVYFDLTGLPPTPAEIHEFLNDDRSEAYEQLIEKLLASPHYGERWGRHWLDIAGYADSEGRTNTDAPRAWAWRYRDYVIKSLNDNKPFDRFLHEQLAGDELAGTRSGDLTPEQIDLLTATGFLRMAADGTGSGDNSEEARNQVVADTVKIVTSSLLGMSFACAQCHDHRYDPISHTDYFALRAVFDPALDWKNWKTPPQRLVSLYTQADREQAAAIEEEAKTVIAERDAKQAEYMAAALTQELEKYEQPLRDELRTAYETPAKDRSEEQKALLAKHPSVNITPGVLYQYNQAAADDLKKYADKIAEIRSRKPAEEFLRVLMEPAGHAPETKLFYRGDYRQPKQTVLPAAPAVLCPEEAFVQFPLDNPDLPTTGRRLAFAKWLTSESNPITSRVLVNRIWMHYFGRGIVASPAEFGKLGTTPTHPELLDWLATEFLQQNWDLKQLHRTILLSTAYRQSSRYAAEMADFDPDNRFYWRKPVKRLEAEIVRDRVLATAGRLDQTLFGKPIPVKEDETGQAVVDGENRRRSLYIQQRRSQPVAMLQAFDAPVMETNCEIRPSSTVATQSLMLMNGDFMLQQSRLFAERVMQADDLAELPSGVRAQLPAILPPAPPVWQFGYGSFNPETSRTAAFTPLPHYEGNTWQGGAQRPDPTIGWVLLNASGGHTGTNPDHAAIRRWTSPQAGTLQITGRLHHPSENGDGVRGRIVGSESGLLGEWIVKHGEAATTVEGIALIAGETIDFITDCYGDVNSDSFNWTVELTLTGDGFGPLHWKSQEGFRGPVPASEQLQPEQLARVWELAYARPAVAEELLLSIQFINQQLHLMQTQPRPLPENVSPSKQALTNFCQALLTSNEFLYLE